MAVSFHIIKLQSIYILWQRVKMVYLDLLLDCIMVVWNLKPLYDFPLIIHTGCLKFYCHCFVSMYQYLLM